MTSVPGGNGLPWEPSSTKERVKFDRVRKTCVPLETFTVPAAQAVPAHVRPPVIRPNKLRGLTLKQEDYNKEYAAIDMRRRGVKSMGPAMSPLVGGGVTGSSMAGSSMTGAAGAAGAAGMSGTMGTVGSGTGAGGAGPGSRGGPRLRMLDGYLMLEAAGTELPSEAIKAELTGKRLGDAVQEDLGLFDRLAFLDAGENTLSLSALRALTGLVELRLHCNSMEYVHLSPEFDAVFLEQERLRAQTDAENEARKAQAAEAEAKRLEAQGPYSGAEGKEVGGVAGAAGTEALVEFQSDAATTEITVQPRIRGDDKSVVLGKPITLETMAFGTQPVIYRWLLNGKVVGQGDSNQLDIPEVKRDHLNAEVVVEAHGAGGVATSNPLVLESDSPVSPLGESKVTDGLEAKPEVELVALPPLPQPPAAPFPVLEVLDLSFNHLDPSSLRALVYLEKLKELDLSCNGFTWLPEELGTMKTLEVLVLERNKLSGGDLFMTLSSAPRLRELNLAQNYVDAIPMECVRGGRGFKSLQWLSLANNYISREPDLLALVKLQRLSQVILYGNPITARAKEKKRKPDGGATEDDALERERMQGHLVNVVTDAPAARTRKAHAFGAYTNFRITKVSEKRMPTNAEWREAGNRHLFAESDSEEEESPRPRERKPSTTKFFVTEMGAGDDDDDDMEDEHGGTLPSSMAMPASLLDPTDLEDGPPDAAKLRTAMNALKHMLKHPVSTHVAAKKPRGYEKMTKNQLVRKRPVVPYELKTVPSYGGGGGHGPPIASMKVIRGPPGASHAEYRSYATDQPYDMSERPARSLAGARGKGGAGVIGPAMGDSLTSFLESRGVMPTDAARAGMRNSTVSVQHDKSGRGIWEADPTVATAPDRYDIYKNPAVVAGRRSPTRSTRGFGGTGGELEALESMLGTMNQRMDSVEASIDVASRNDESVGLLTSMVGRVMRKYE